MERLQGSAGPAQLSLLAGSSRRLLREGSALFNGLGIHGAGGQSPRQRRHRSDLLLDVPLAYVLSRVNPTWLFSAGWEHPNKGGSIG